MTEHFVVLFNCSLHDKRTATPSCRSPKRAFRVYSLRVAARGTCGQGSVLWPAAATAPAATAAAADVATITQFAD